MTNEEGHDIATDAAWLESLSDAAIAPSPGGEALLLAPPLDRVRPERGSIVPRAAWVSVAAIVGAFILIGVIIAWAGARSALPVPDVVGLDVGVGRTMLSRVGLSLTVTEERFSSSPKNVILEQSPATSAQVRRGDSIEVIVSAGTEDFTMPDVVGDGLALATGMLEERGLSVEVERVISDAASDTVLSSVPAAGAVVRTGDLVHLQVASPRDPSIVLRPFRMDGVVVVIDPAPAPTGLSRDPVIEVARRLEAMLGASGARVVVLRSSLDTATSDGARSKRAQESSGTVCVGISVSAGADAGRIVSVPPSQTPDIGSSSEKLGSAFVTALGASVGPVKRSVSSYDPVLTAARAPWVRVLIGAAGARDDTTAFSDPGWIDRVARALYSSLGEVYGQAVTP